MKPTESASHDNVVDITAKLAEKQDISAIADVVGEELKARQQQLLDQGWTLERTHYLMATEFGPRIARLAMRNGITPEIEELLGLIEPEIKPSEPPLTRWAQRQHAMHGNDDARTRQLPRGDRD